MISENIEEIVTKGYPNLKLENVTKIQDLIRPVLTRGKMKTWREFASTISYLSHYLTPRVLRLLADTSATNMMWTTPYSMHTIFAALIEDQLLSWDTFRPVGGISKIVESMAQNIADLGGQIHVNQDVTSIEKAGSMESFLVTTPRARYKAKRLVLAVPPGPLASIQGKVIEQIKKERMFNSVQSVEAFRAVATYKNPWWEQGNGSAGLTGMEEFVSHSNGIGYIFPYR